MTALRRAVIVANRGDDDPGLVGTRLAAHGFSWETWWREDWRSWTTSDVASRDLIVSLGSDWSVYWPEVADAVAMECVALRIAHERGVPVLAICFGAQVASHALGGVVCRAPRHEVGWFEVTVTTDAPSWLSSGPWFEWHIDRFSIPEGAVELAATAAGPQAFISARTFAVQFHPEVTPAIVQRWVDGSAESLDEMGVDAESLLRVSGSEAAVQRTEVLIDGFLADIAESGDW